MESGGRKGDSENEDLGNVGTPQQSLDVYSGGDEEDSDDGSDHYDHDDDAMDSASGDGSGRESDPSPMSAVAMFHRTMPPTASSSYTGHQHTSTDQPAMLVNSADSMDEDGDRNGSGGGGGGGMSPSSAMCDRVHNMHLHVQSETMAMAPRGTATTRLEDDDSDSDEQDGIYCICRQPASKVDDRFMICCDQCSDWFHGDCVGITDKKAKTIEKFHCPPCREKNPSLEIVYRPPKMKMKKHHPFSDKGPRKRSSRMCGECEACMRPDCGKCRFCTDMRKFGGPNKLRQKCIYRRCINLSKPVSDTQLALDRAWENKNPGSMGIDPDMIPAPRKGKAEREAARAAKEIERARKKAEKAEKKAAKAEKKAAKIAAAASAELTEKPRRGRRPTKHRLTSSGLPRAHSDRSDSHHRHHLRTLQQCWGPGCMHQSRSGSKYCSDECGRELALKRLQRYLPERFALWSKTGSSKSHDTLKASIVNLERQELEIQVKIAELKERSVQFEAIVEQCRALVPVSEEEAADLEEQEVEVDLQIDCVCCGHPTNFRKALQHMERCYGRIEGLMSFGSVFKTKAEGISIFCDFYSQGQYCKRLRVLCPDHYKEPKAGQDDVCGCPLSADVFVETSSHCLMPKRLCHSHVGWERLRQATIDMDRLNWLLKLEETQEQLHILKEQVRASGHILGVVLHATVPHGEGLPDTFSMVHGFPRKDNPESEDVEVDVTGDANPATAGQTALSDSAGSSPPACTATDEKCDNTTTASLSQQEDVDENERLQQPGDVTLSSGNHQDTPMDVAESTPAAASDSLPATTVSGGQQDSSECDVLASNAADNSASCN